MLKIREDTILELIQILNNLKENKYENKKHI